MTVALTGIVIFAISLLGGLLLARRNATEQPRQVRILRFALFFWMLAFLQLLVVALGYALLTR
jgi:hypothetical protein